MAEQDPYDQTETSDALGLVQKNIADCERRYHNLFVQKVERRYDAYRGLAEITGEPGRDEDEDDWHSSITTPYVLQTCEGMLATMLEPNPKFNVRPRPRPEEALEDVLARMQSVDAIADVLQYALDRAHFPQQQRDFMQQDLIAGITVFKDYWLSERRTVTSLGSQTLDIQDGFGNVIDKLRTHVERKQEDTLVVDDAHSEVRDVRDFFWPPQASRMDNAEYVIDRTWVSFAYLKRMELAGVYKNIDQLQGTGSAGKLGADITRREMRLRNQDRTQNLVELLERWTPERVITVANRSVVISDKPNPFWNGRLPFVVCSAMPDAFQVPGISVVEALAQLQEMLWTLQNQRLDVVRMLANMITVIRSDVDDPEAFEWAPNAQWLVEDPAQVNQLRIDPTVANITLQAEGLIKGDLQNIMGGLPMASGADSETIDQQTATGVSIITTIAQRIIQARKQHYLWAYAELGKHFLLLWQQFVRDDRVIKILGPVGAEAFKVVSPLEYQGDFDVTIDVTSDSLMRQERRAEAQSLLQIAAQVQPIFATSGAPLNLKAFMEKTLDAYDVPDKERYFLQKTPPGQLPTGAPPPSPQQQQPQPNGNGAGVTNVPLAAGPSSPSNVTSMSPEAAMAQMMAKTGGIANQGGGGAPGG